MWVLSGKFCFERKIKSWMREIGAFFVFLQLISLIFCRSVQMGSGKFFKIFKWKMNRCSIQRNSFVSSEEMKNATVVCPKPRRLSSIGATVNDPSSMRSRRCIYQQEICDVKAGNELLDIILTKGGCADQSVAQYAPPFFSGSPPSRVSNPLIQDSRFGDKKFAPVSPRAILASSGLGSSPSSTRNGGFARAKFGSSPTVRVEGFDCLDRGRRNHSIPALA